MYGLVVPLFGRSFYPEKSLLDRYGNDDRYNLDRYHANNLRFGADTFTRIEAPLERKAPRRIPFTP